MTLRCLTVATLVASLLAALYVGLWMAARRAEDEADARLLEEAIAKNAGRDWSRFRTLDEVMAGLSEPDPYLVTGIGS